MGYSNQFLIALGANPKHPDKEIRILEKKTGIPKDRLCYYNDNNIVPSGLDLELIQKKLKINKQQLMLSMGRLDKDLIEAIQYNADNVYKTIASHKPTLESSSKPAKEVFKTKLGKLYQGDCYSFLKQIDSDSVDMVFADPPFNLNKLYPSKINDNLKTEKYIHWCQEWLDECTRVLKPGGSLFLWNLPKWNANISSFLDGKLTFRHWIGVDIKYRLPIQGRLYPSHYSLLYYVKGEKPNVFHPDRLPMQVCPYCYGDLKDYGGYKDKMNPLGVNLSDIWTDIPPVRHTKYKRRDGANELSLKLLDRIVEMSTNNGDIVLDPFGGSGTTYMAAELKGRKWLGCEIGPVTDIKNRFKNIKLEKKILDDYREDLNQLFPKRTLKKRNELGLWTCDSVRHKSRKKQLDLI